MGHLSNRHIIIGVSGGIAAYKAGELVRLFRKQGAEVRVILSRGAQAFITPLTFQALSGNPVHTELLDASAEAGMGHIELARWADAVVIAPSTADVIARLAHGRADDLLTTVALATAAPLFVAPAMNQQMWANAATQSNVHRLVDAGTQILGPDAGEQACGDNGPGRLLDPERIAQLVCVHFDSRSLSGLRVVITAGPTREPLDPVRFLSNHSSGKMGFALARAAREAGAETVLIAGPVNLETPEGVQRIDVETALDMLEAAQSVLPGTDIFIAAAAVADYRPDHCADQKIKKSDDQLSFALIKNPDIVATISASLQRPALVVGFAAETEQLEQYAEGKRIAKQLDFIVANDVSRADIGFNSDANAVTVFGPQGQRDFPVASKGVVAAQLLRLLAEHLSAANIPASNATK